MKTADHSDSNSVISRDPFPVRPKPLAPPEYRQQVLRTIIDISRDKGMDSMSLSELVVQLRDQSLRDDIDPNLEPLSLLSIDAALTDLERTRELTLRHRTVVFSPPAAPGGEASA